MKRFLYNNGWVFLIVGFIVIITIMLRIASPDEIKAKENPYDIPQSVIDSAEKWGGEYGISPELLESIAWVESRYNPNVSNKAGTCHGLMQISYSAHGSRMAKLGVSNIFDLDGNMHVAADYLAELFEEYEELPVVLAIYNGQSQTKVNMAMYDGYISPYAQEIMDMSYELETLRGKHSRARFTPGLDWSKAVG